MDIWKYSPGLSRFNRFEKYLAKQGLLHNAKAQEPELWKALVRAQRKKRLYIGIRVFLYAALFSSLIATILSRLGILVYVGDFLLSFNGLLGSTVVLILIFIFYNLIYFLDVDQQFYIATIIARVTPRKGKKGP